MTNSIVGACSVITKQFEEENVILAGNPAKIVKQNVKWGRKGPDEYLENPHGCRESNPSGC